MKGKINEIKVPVRNTKRQQVVLSKDHSTKTLKKKKKGVSLKLEIASSKRMPNTGLISHSATGSPNSIQKDLDSEEDHNSSPLVLQRAKMKEP